MDSSNQSPNLARMLQHLIDATGEFVGLNGDVHKEVGLQLQVHCFEKLRDGPEGVKCQLVPSD